MIEGLKPYAEYKESGQEWLGRVPSHWDVRRTKLILREVDSRSTTGKEQLLRVSQYTGVTQRKAADGSDSPDTRAASLIGYKRVFVHDLVINIMLAWNGSMGVSRFDGIASPAYCVYRLNKGAQPWYFHQLFRLPLYKGRIKAVSTGVIESRLRLYSDDLGRIEAILPPPDEQAAIVRFLDHANRKIDGFIRAKRKLIGLLNEQKQAIIHRAVTGKDEVRMVKDENGNSTFILQPSTLPKKPSGIPWLGDIPKHWKVWPLKRIGWFKSGAGFPVTEQGKQNLEMPFLKVSDMTRPGNEVWIESCNNTVSRDDADRLGAFVFPAGSIIFPKVGGAMLTNKRRLLKRPSCIDNNVMGCVVRRGRLEFVFLLLQQLDFGRLSKPGPVPAIGEGEVREIKVVFPPLDEQKAIVPAVEKEAAALTTAIARTEREIALMQEYRTRLTADLVTGKLDVREAAAQLPAPPVETAVETETDEPLEETETEEIEA